MGRSTASDSIQDNGLKTERKPSAAELRLSPCSDKFFLISCYGRDPEHEFKC